MVCLFGWVGSPRLIFQKQIVEMGEKDDTCEIMGGSFFVASKR